MNCIVCGSDNIVYKSKKLCIKCYAKQHYYDNLDVRKAKQRQYYQTLEGHINRMAVLAIGRAKRDELPCVSKEILINFIKHNWMYMPLYSYWAENGFKRKDAPSLDRMDVLGGYTLNNIQILTQSENVIKGRTVDRLQKISARTI